MAPGRWWGAVLPRVVTRAGRRVALGTGHRELSRRSHQDLLAALGVPQPGRAGGSVAFLRRRTEGEEPGCPACRAADEETRRWFFFFETETNADEALRARLVAAGGMCAPHTRRLLDQGASSSWLAKSLFDLLVRDARRHPHGAPGRRSGPCPVCTAVGDRVADLLGMLASALDAPAGSAPDRTPAGRDGAGAAGSREVEAAYRAGTGLCVPHTRQFLAVAPAGPSAVVAEVLADRLATTPELAAGLLTGDDTDAPARSRLRAAAAPGVLRADAVARAAGLPDRVEALLTRPCCPVCAARATTTWRLLDWIGSGAALPPAEVSGAEMGGAGVAGTEVGGPGAAVAGPTGPSLVRRDGGRPRRRPATGAGVRDQLASLCATHLADLVCSDGEGGWLSEPVATVVRLAAARWRSAAGSAARAAAGVAGGAAAAGGSANGDGSRGWSQPRTAAQLLAPTTACVVCSQADQAADREVVLLRLVGADPGRSGRIVGSHGPCQRCRTAVTGHPVCAAGVPWEQAATARTAELAFELTDALRQDSWTARWDVHGAELTAWRRAPTRLDGDVLGPPPPDPAASRQPTARDAEDRPPVDPDHLVPGAATRSPRR